MLATLANYSMSVDFSTEVNVKTAPLNFAPEVHEIGKHTQEPLSREKLSNPCPVRA